MEIIVDTREQNPFDIEALVALYGTNATITREKLDCGDYSIRGMEREIVLERKATAGELYNNLATKKAKERFYREMELLDKVKAAYIICEFPMTDLYCFPKNSGIPKGRMKYLKINAAYFRKLVYEVSDNFAVEYIFCENRKEAESTAFELLLKACKKDRPLPF